VKKCLYNKISAVWYIYQIEKTKSLRIS